MRSAASAGNLVSDQNAQGSSGQRKPIKHILGCPNYRPPSDKGKGKRKKLADKKDSNKINKDDSGGDWSLVDYDAPGGRSNSLIGSSKTQDERIKMQTHGSFDDSSKIMTT